MAVVGLVVAAWASPAVAKGPDQATITGPSLDAPIVVNGHGEPGSGDSLGVLADGSGLFQVLFESGRGLLPSAPAEPLGPKFELTYRMPDGTSTGSTVRQDLYPLAPGGPLTYTESGQKALGTMTSGGWYRAPGALRAVLQALGLPTSPVTAVTASTPASAAAPASSPAGTPWLPIAVAVVVGLGVLAGVLFGLRRANAGRSGALPSSGGSRAHADA